MPTFRDSLLCFERILRHIVGLERLALACHSQVVCIIIIAEAGSAVLPRDSAAARERIRSATRRAAFQILESRRDWCDLAQSHFMSTGKRGNSARSKPANPTLFCFRMQLLLFYVQSYVAVCCPLQAAVKKKNMKHEHERDLPS